MVWGLWGDAVERTGCGGGGGVLPGGGVCEGGGGKAGGGGGESGHVYCIAPGAESDPGSRGAQCFKETNV